MRLFFQATALITSSLHQMSTTDYAGPLILLHPFHWASCTQIPKLSSFRNKIGIDSYYSYAYIFSTNSQIQHERTFEITYPPYLHSSCIKVLTIFYRWPWNYIHLWPLSMLLLCLEISFSLLPSESNKAMMNTNAQQLWLLTQGLYKTGPFKIFYAEVSMSL